jgi:hypothetical protein
MPVWVNSQDRDSPHFNTLDNKIVNNTTTRRVRAAEKKSMEYYTRKGR